MAHPVKCTICGEVFDRDRVECVNTATRRYAHKSCYNKEQGTLSEEEKYRQKIFDFTQNLFEKNFNKKLSDTFSPIFGQIFQHRRNFLLVV